MSIFSKFIPFDRLERHLSDTWRNVVREPLGQLLPDQPEPPKMPAVDTPRLPTSADAKKSRRLSILAQAKRRGRAATILTSSNSTDTLGA